MLKRLKNTVMTILYGQWDLKVVSAADGKGDFVKRRWHNGAWEYAEPTDEEMREAAMLHAIR